MAFGNEIQFHGRTAWVNFKRAVGIPRNADKDYFCKLIIRAMINKEIHPDTQFTGYIREGEGFGSQALSRLTIAATAHSLGYKYVHTPLVEVGHGPSDIVAWTDRWESVFNLGQGEMSIRQSNLEQIDYRTYAEDKSLWKQPFIVAARDFAAYPNYNPQSYRDYLASRKVPLFVSLKEQRNNENVNIAIHVRRGDVNKKTVKHRFTSNDDIRQTVLNIQNVLRNIGRPFVVTLYSNGMADEFADLSDLNICLDLGAVETVKAFINADVFVTANSMFSYLAAIVSDAAVLFERHAFSPLPGWIPIRSDRGFDDRELLAQIRARLPS